MLTNNLIILGTGGHAKVVLDATLRSHSNYKINLYDQDPHKAGLNLAGLTIELAPSSLNEIHGNIHIAIGNNAIRAKLYNLITSAVFFSIIHPTAVISLTSAIGKGSFIAGLSILAPQSKIGEGCIINHGAIIDHDVEVGAYSHIAPNATLGGNVTIGREVLIGAGAVILPGIKIGNGAIVGAGSVVTRNIAENSIVKGSPAK